VAYDSASPAAVTSQQVNVTSVSLDGTDDHNYTVATTGSTTATITPRVLSVVYSGVDKVYDGSRTATVTTTDNRLGSDVLTVLGTASYADKNVAYLNGAVTYKTVSVAGVSLTGADATNYSVASTGSTTATITPRALNVAYTGDTLVYNGGTVATVSTTDDRVSGDVFDIMRTASFADKNVGSNKAVSVSGVYLSNPSGVSTVDANNYTVVSTASTVANITPRALAVTYTGVTKEYDGLTLASVTTSDDRVTGDTFSINRTANFVSKNVGWTSSVLSPVNILVTGASLTGTDAANYSLVSTGIASAIITPKALSAALVGNISKTYDGDTSATLSNSNFSVTGFVTVAGVTEGTSVTQTSGTYNSRNVLDASSASTTLTSAQFTANTGTVLTNYVLPTSATGTATITPSALTVTYTGVDKTYDGNAVAQVTPTYQVISHANGGSTTPDDVSIVRIATFDNKNVGTSKAISITGVSLSGADASNYVVASTGSATGAVNRLSSVTWVGGASGDWLNPSNWTGGAVPDLSNVAEVVIPSGSTVNFNTTHTGLAQVGTVSLTQLSATGATLAQSTGTLNVTGNANVGTWLQTDGTTTVGGNFVSTDGFTQGRYASLAVTGTTTVGSSGAVTLSNLSSTGALSVTATGSSITQLTPMVMGSDTTLTGNGISFNNTVNGAHRLVINDTGNTVFTQSVGDLAYGAAPLHLETNALSTTFTGPIVRTSGPSSMVFNNPVVLTAASTLFDTTNNGTLATGANMTFANGVSGTAANTQTVTFTAGTHGVISIAGALGSVAVPFSTMTFNGR